MKLYKTPIKLTPQSKDPIDHEILRFMREIEDLLGAPPSFRDRVYKMEDDNAVVFAVDLEPEDLRKVEKHSKNSNYEVVEREWESLAQEFGDENRESFDINAVLVKSKKSWS